MRLIPAYGRSYATRDKMLKDWISGKDFKITGGPYCSNRDIISMRKQFDSIDIYWYNTTTKRYVTTNMYRSPLRGLTSYV